MCDPVSIGTAVLGLGMSYMGQRQQNSALEAASSERNRYRDLATQNDARTQNFVDQRHGQSIDLYRPENFTAAMDRNQNAVEGSLNNAVLEANLALDDRTGGGGARGATSDDYQRLSAQRSAESAATVAELAKRYAQLAGPNYAAFDQAVQMGGFNDDINAALASTGRHGQIADNAAGLVNVQPNPMAGVLGIGGQALMGHGISGIIGQIKAPKFSAGAKSTVGPGAWNVNTSTGAVQPWGGTPFKAPATYKGPVPAGY